MPPLFGLAPGGVYRAGDVAAAAVRSCRTLSTLPVRSRAVCFLWHYPSIHRKLRTGRALPGTVVPWSPDFPRPRIKCGAAAARSPGGCHIGGTESFFESTANFTIFIGTGAIFVKLVM